MLKQFALLILLSIQSGIVTANYISKDSVPKPILDRFISEYPKANYTIWLEIDNSTGPNNIERTLYRANFNYSASNKFLHIEYYMDSGTVKTYSKDSTIVPENIISRFHSFFPKDFNPVWYCDSQTNFNFISYKAYFEYKYTDIILTPISGSQNKPFNYPLLERVKQLYYKLPTVQFNEDSTGYNLIFRKTPFIHKYADSMAEYNIKFLLYKKFRDAIYSTSGRMDIKDSLTYCSIELGDSCKSSNITLHVRDNKTNFEGIFPGSNYENWYSIHGIYLDSTFLTKPILKYLKKHFQDVRYNIIGVNIKGSTIKDIDIEIMNRKFFVKDMTFDNMGNLTIPPDKKWRSTGL